MNSNLHPIFAECLRPFVPPDAPGYNFRGFNINPFMLSALQAYVERGEAVGHFLTAVLENNLREAVGRADDENLHNLPAYVGYLYNVADSRCWGSPEKVRQWYMAKAQEESETRPPEALANAYPDLANAANGLRSQSITTGGAV